LDSTQKVKIIFFAIGLVFSLVTIIGVFMLWMTGNIGISPWTRNVGTASGWDIAKGDVTFNSIDLTREQSPLPLFTLAGGIIAFFLPSWVFLPRKESSEYRCLLADYRPWLARYGH